MRDRYFARPTLPLKLAAALCVLGAGASGRAQPAARDTLAARLRDAVARSPIADRMSLTVRDAATGAVVFSHRHAEPMNPASNMKLLTASAALLELGPHLRLRTGLYGRIEAGAVTGGLCLKGFGDPTLATADLLGFAQRLVDEGVREVDELIVDGSYFDDKPLPPAFDQQPNETSAFRAAVAALSVNRNAYTLRVRPADHDGAPAIVNLDASGYFEVDNGLLTRAGAATKVIVSQRAAGDRLALTLRGTLPLGGASLAYARRAAAPLPYAGHAFIDALRALRIAVPRRVVVGPCPAGAPILTVRRSRPLGHVLAALGKDSDNFVAEMVLKLLGAERAGRPGTSEGGVAVTLAALRKAGVDTKGLVMVNGSGLFRGNRVSTAQLAQILVTMYGNAGLRDEFVAHLAVGAVDGTLAKRFAKLGAPRIVRAKTGTLDDVIALSGYVLGRRPGSAYAFSYLANDVSGKHADARDLVDRVVGMLAAELHPPR